MTEYCSSTFDVYSTRLLSLHRIRVEYEQNTKPFFSISEYHCILMYSKCILGGRRNDGFEAPRGGQQEGEKRKDTSHTPDDPVGVGGFGVRGIKIGIVRSWGESFLVLRLLNETPESCECLIKKTNTQTKVI